MTLKHGSSGIPMGKIQGGSGGSGGGVSFVIVTELPEIGESGVFYLVPATGATSPNIYTEYIWIADENRYEKIGDKEVDLSNYYTKTETYNKTEVTVLLEKKQDVFDTVAPLEMGSLYLGGSKLYNFDDRYATMSSDRTSSLNRSTYSTQYMYAYNINTGNQLAFTSLTQLCDINNISYIDVPFDGNALYEKAIESGTSCTGYVHIGGSGTISASYMFAGEVDKTGEFTPYFYMALAYGGANAHGQFGYGTISVTNNQIVPSQGGYIYNHSTSTATQQYARMGFQCNPAGTNPLVLTGTLQDSGHYITTAQPITGTANLRKVNTVRCFFSSASFVIDSHLSSAIIDGNSTGWNLINGGTTLYDLHLKYDNTTLGVNSDGELYALGSINTVSPLEVAEVSQRQGGIGKAYVASTETEIETNDISAYNTDRSIGGAVSLLLSGPIGYTTTNNVPGVDWTQDWEFEVKNVVIKSNTDWGALMQVVANGGASVSVYPYNSGQKLYFSCNMGTGAMSTAHVDYNLNTSYDFKFTKRYNSTLMQTVVTMAYCESGETYSARIIHNVTGYTAPTYSYIALATTYQDVNRADISLGDVTFISNGVTLYNGGTIVTEDALKLNYNSTLELDANNKLGVSSSVLGYTKAETDELLDEKQDSFTTEAPLEMGSITRGGAYNITTSSGRIVNDYQQALTFDSNTSGVVAISNANISNSPSTLSEFFTGNCSYFDIPTDAGARIANGENFVGKVWLNCGALNSSYYPMFIWGYKNSQGEFIPVVFQRGFYTGGMFSGFVDSVSNVDTNTINLNCTTYSDVSNLGRGSSDYNGYYGYVGVLQYVSSSQTVVLNTVRQNNTEYYFNGCQTQDAAILANAEQINMVRVFAWMDGGYPPVSATYRVNGTDTDWNINDAAVTSTILELNYDDTTLGVDESGNLYAKDSGESGTEFTPVAPLELVEVPPEVNTGVAYIGGSTTPAAYDVVNISNSSARFFGTESSYTFPEIDQTKTTVIDCRFKYLQMHTVNNIVLYYFNLGEYSACQVGMMSNTTGLGLRINSAAPAAVATLAADGTIYDTRLTINPDHSYKFEYKASTDTAYTTIEEGTGTFSTYGYNYIRIDNDLSTREYALVESLYDFKITNGGTTIFQRTANPTEGGTYLQLQNAIIAAMGMPSTTSTTLTAGATGTSYTAPANGYYYLYGSNAGSASCWCRLTNDDTGIVDQRQLSANYGNITLLMLARKNETVTLSYDKTNIIGLYFIYAVGSESEAPTS